MPCSNRNGGASPWTWKIGLASAARSVRSDSGPPISWASRDSGFRGSVPRSPGSPARSLGVYQADHGADPGRRPDEADLAVEVGSGQAEQRRQMTTGRLAPGGDPFRIDPDLVRAGPQPTHCGLGVVQLSGPDGFTAQSVIDAGHREAGGGDPFEGSGSGVGESRTGAAPTAQPPAAAVQEDHDRHRADGIRRQVEIQFQRSDPGEVGVRLAGQDHDAGGTDEAGCQREIVEGRWRGRADGAHDSGVRPADRGVGSSWVSKVFETHRSASRGDVRNRGAIVTVTVRGPISPTVDHAERMPARTGSVEFGCGA